MRKDNSNKMNQDGFTLIEVMITMFILSFAIGGMASFNVAMSKYNQTASEATTASLIAQQKMEALINTGYEALPNGAFGPEASNLEYNKGFEVEWNVSTSGAHKEINVTVSYNVRGYNEFRKVSLKTAISS